MKSIFLDTNILFSAFIKPEGNCGIILKALTQKSDWQMLTSAYVIYELYSQQLKPRFQKRFDIANFIVFIEAIVDSIPVVNPMLLAERIRDTKAQKDLSPKDLHIWAAFQASKCDYLLTGNIKDFPASENVITPTQLLSIIEQ